MQRDPFILRSAENPAQPEGGASDSIPAGDAQLTPEDQAAEALQAASRTVADINREVDSASTSADTPPLELPEFESGVAEHPVNGIDLLSKVNLNVRIELGRTRMLVEDVLRLNEGSVVELDKLAGDPVDVYVNDRHVACGEVLVLNDTFCVRISEIFARGDEGAEN